MADKLKMQTENLADKNFELLSKMFPNALTETITGYDDDGKPIVERAIDADVLRQEISCKVVEGKDERYQFTWPDKKKAVLLANTPIDKTLRPCREESVDFDNTENLYIEGDNLEVLKLLHETYLGKVKMIYIDPPYNTGNDFVYEDDFTQSMDEYRENSGQFDDYGNRLVKNMDSNGRYHTDWLNMIYPRLKLAKDLLTDDVVIFISIDDNEQENLKKCCDEIFGSGNFVAQLIWERAFAPKNDAKYISNSHDYILMYAKKISDFVIGRLPRTEEANARYSNPDNDPRGVWQSDNLTVKTYSPSGDYPITTPSGRVVEPPAGRCWRLSKKVFLERLQDNRIWFGADGNGVPRIKRFLSELKFDGMAPTSLLFYKDVGHSQEGSQELIKIMDGGVFDGPKPTRLLKRLITLSNLDKDSIVLDFFSGSATTAQALMEMNVEKNTCCKFIMVQVTENANDKKNTGYKNICEIGKERIRRVSKRIKDEKGFVVENINLGFRVLKCDSSNMKDIYYTPSETQQSLFDTYADNIKEDRTPEDLLFQVMLDLGVLLSSKIEETTIAGKQVYNVADGFLIACFDKDVTEETVKAVAEKKPYYAVFRDSSMANDSVATNFDQIFASISPDTVRKVL